MDIFKRMGNKTLKLVLMLVFVILFSVFSLVIGNIQISTFLIISLLGFIFIVLNIQARQQEVLLEANSFMDKAEEAIKDRQLKAAIRFYDEAMFLNPKLIKAQIGKGRCYRGLTEFSKAIEELNTALEMESAGEKAEIYFLMGACRMEEGNRKEAQQEFEKVLNIDPNYHDVLPYMADLKHFDGKNDEASKLYVRYLEKCHESKRKLIIDRLEKVDPEKAKEFKEKEKAEKTQKIAVGKKSITKAYKHEYTEAEISGEKTELSDEERESLPPVDGGYDEDSFRLPGYIKKESSVSEPEDDGMRLPGYLKQKETKADESNSSVESPSPDAVSPKTADTPSFKPVKPPVQAVTSSIKTMSVEDVMGEASFVEESTEPVAEEAPPPLPVKAKTKESVVFKPVKPPVQVESATVKTMSVEDVMGDASFVEEAPEPAFEEATPPPPVKAQAKESPAFKSVNPPAQVVSATIKTLSVEDVMGDSSFVSEAEDEKAEVVKKSIKVAVKKAERPQLEIPADLNKVLDEIKTFAKFAGTVEVDPMLRWSAFSYINRFISNIRYLFPEAPAFATRAAKHKLDQLNGFKSDYKTVEGLSRYFQDVFISMNNIGVIDAFNVFRSSQPSLTDLSWLINNMDVKAVINLCKENQIWTGYTLKDEEDLCGEMLVDYFHMPMENWDDPSLTKEGIDEIIDRIDFHAKPVLIHSSNGTDRVGIVAAAYRMKFCRWSFDEALDEAQKYGFDMDDHQNHLALLKQYSQ